MPTIDSHEDFRTVASEDQLLSLMTECQSNGEGHPRHRLGMVLEQNHRGGLQRDQRHRARPVQ
jgi:hypothetical protein